MPKIRLANGTYVIREDGTPGPWKLALRMTAETALERSASLRSKGIQAEAIADSGGESIEPRISAPVNVSEAIDWTGIPWRIAPTRTGNGVYIYAFRDPDSNTTHSISGKTPQEVVDRLQIDHPVYTKHVASLSPVESQPTTQAPAAESASGPTRVLRPGSQTALRYAELPERPVQTPPVRQDLISWTNAASVAQLKERMKADPVFLAWYQQQQ